MVLVERGLEYLGLFFGGLFGHKGYLAIREKRANGNGNGKNGKAALADVVNAVRKLENAIRDEGDQTRDAIFEDGDRTRESLIKTQDVIRGAHDKTIESIERASEKQLSICQSQVLRAEAGLKDLQELRRESGK